MIFLSFPVFISSVSGCECV